MSIRRCMLRWRQFAIFVHCRDFRRSAERGRLPSCGILSFLTFASGCAPLTTATSEKACEFAGGGLARCTVEWNTGHNYKTACDYISKVDAEKVLGGPVSKPIDILNPFIVGGPPAGNGELNCEISLLVQPQTGATRMITLAISVGPFNRSNSPTQLAAIVRNTMVDVQDIEWSRNVAFWGRFPAEDDPYGRLCVFSDKAVVSVEVIGFEDSRSSLEKAKMIASAALASVRPRVR